LLNDPTNDRITVLFIELPCQILWTISCLLLLRWLKPRKSCSLTCRCCMGSLREFITVIVVLNLGLFIAYLVILFSSSDGRSNYPGTALSYNQIIVSFVWFSWYIFFCLMALFWFVIATLAAFCELMGGALTDKSTLIKRSILLALLVAIMVFVGQTSVQIRTFIWTNESPFPQFQNWTIQLFFTQLLIVDLIPTIPIIYSASISAVGGTNFNPFQTRQETEDQSHL